MNLDLEYDVKVESFLTTRFRQMTPKPLQVEARLEEAMGLSAQLQAVLEEKMAEIAKLQQTNAILQRTADAATQDRERDWETADERKRRVQLLVSVNLLSSHLLALRPICLLSCQCSVCDIYSVH